MPQFTVTIESIFGLKAGGTYYVKWVRGVKVAAIDQFSVPRDQWGKSAFPVNQSMSLLVTLYREEGKKFDTKEAKLSVVAVNPSKRQERTVSKMRLDLSQFAGVPAASSTKQLSMSDKVSMRVNIESRFLNAGATGSGSGGASSALSSIDGASARSSEEDDDEFDDLGLDDVPDPDVSPAVVPPRQTSNLGLSASKSDIGGKPLFAQVGVTPKPQLATINSSNNGAASVMAASESLPMSNSFPSSGVASTSTTSLISAREAETERHLNTILPHPNNSNDDARITMLSKENERLSMSLEETRNKYENFELTHHREIDSLKKQLEKCAKEAADATLDRETTADAHRHENDMLMQRLEDSKQEAKAAAESCDAAKGELSRLRIENDDLKRSNEDARAEMVKTRAALEMQASDSHDLNADVARMRAERDEAHETVRKTKEELVTARRNLEEFRLRCKRLEAVEARSAELSNEVDRLTIAVARKDGEAESDSANNEIERRISALQDEKTSLSRKIRSHETHAAEMKSAYDQLRDMYDKLRNDHTKLQNEQVKDRSARKEAQAAAEALKAENESILEAKASIEKKASLEIAAAVEAKVQAEAKTKSEMKAATDAKLLAQRSLQKGSRIERDDEELATTRQLLREVKASKEALQVDYEELRGKVDTLQDRLDSTSEALSAAQQELDDAYAEVEEVKEQRDSAMKRALSKGKSSNSESGSARSSLRLAEDELRTVRESHGREQTELRKRVEELEALVDELRDDVNYEKGEKTRAREERDKIREMAKALERRTSQAARTTDEMHSLRRKLSTHQTRVQDYEQTLAVLRSENEELRRDLDQTRRAPRDTPGVETDVGEVLSALVIAKLALAEAKGEKQNLEFEMKKLRKNDRAIQDRLASHASRLEVQLAQANQEIDRMRKGKQSESVSEFNELGSDVDY